MIDADTALDRNLQAFTSRLPTLLAEYRGQYVIVAEQKIVSVYPTYEEAVTAGYRLFPSDDQPYLLQKIAPIPERADFHLACRVS